VQGLREAKAAFQALPLIMRENSLAATETTASEHVRFAKGKLESSPSVDTRSLLNSVAYSVNRNNGRARAGITNVSTRIGKVRVRGIVIAGRGGSASTSQGAKLIKPSKYGPKVEFGTRFMQAEPFMIPAAESQKGPYVERMRHAGKGVEKDTAAIGMRNL
jgi:hypothetical protein